MWGPEDRLPWDQDDPTEAQVADLRQELDEVTECFEANCKAPCAPAGKPYVAGVDDQDRVVRFRKWRCAAGHRYQREWD